jgi:hypothetical protein
VEIKKKMPLLSFKTVFAFASHISIFLDLPRVPLSSLPFDPHTHTPSSIPSYAALACQNRLGRKVALDFGPCPRCSGIYPRLGLLILGSCSHSSHADTDNNVLLAPLGILLDRSPIHCYSCRSKDQQYHYQPDPHFYHRNNLGRSGREGGKGCWRVQEENLSGRNP